jgi:tRNA (guanine37-N1)-methyltransferase
MRIDVLTLFPGAFAGPLDISIIGRAREEGLLDLVLHNIRDYASGRHRTVDDYPFGGGPGMVLRVDVLDAAFSAVRGLDTRPVHTIYLSPQGQHLDDRLARELATLPRLVLVCGRYEGVDQRFIDHRVDREVSIGDYIVTGGELPAMVLIDAVSRHLPGVLGDEASPQDESFRDGLLEGPQYTRPATYGGWQAPPVLLSGDAARIARWRRRARLAWTAARRPDLLPADASGRPPVKAGRAKIRTGTVQDLPEVVALWASAGPAVVLGNSDTEWELRRKLTRDPDLFLVAEARKRVVGAVLGGWDGRRGHVYHLAVAERHRGGGFGSALLSELEERLAFKGCLRANLQVADGAPDLIAFYTTRGWQVRPNAVMARDLRPASPEEDR